MAMVKLPRFVEQWIRYKEEMRIIIGLFQNNPSTYLLFFAANVQLIQSDIYIALVAFVFRMAIAQHHLAF